MQTSVYDAQHFESDAVLHWQPMKLKFDLFFHNHLNQIYLTHVKMGTFMHFAPREPQQAHLWLTPTGSSRLLCMCAML